MVRKPPIDRVSEADIAFGMLVIAAFQPNGIASFHRLKIEIPNHVRLSTFDVAQSIMRPNEEMWVQKIRNIKANRDVSASRCI